MQTDLLVTHGCLSVRDHYDICESNLSVPVGVLNEIINIIQYVFDHFTTTCILIPKEVIKQLKREEMIPAYYYGLLIYTGFKSDPFDLYCGFHDEMKQVLNDPGLTYMRVSAKNWNQ